MTKRLVKKTINAHSMTWTAPANVTSVVVSVYDDFNTLVKAGYNYSLALKADGSAWGWGPNNLGQLGDGTTTTRLSPTQAIGGHSFVQINCAGGQTLALKANGSAWSWGFNGQGQLGDGSITNRSSPVPVIGGHSFVQINTKLDHILALKADGSAWSWGNNANGQLGDGTGTSGPVTNNKSSPVAVIGGHSFIQVSAGGFHSLALKADGSAWAWGNNGGQLGDGTVVNKSSPVAVIGGHSFIQISGGSNHSLALKADGSAWAWGNNNRGQLGDGTIVNKSSPVPVVGGHSFIQISGGDECSLALKANGSAWAWGINTQSELGDGTTTTRSSPVPVIGGHSFIQIDSAANYGSTTLQGTHSLALKADGSVWAWGRNANGQLGDGTAVNRSSPIQVVGGQLFEAGSIFINRAVLQVTPGTTYNLNFFLTQIGNQIFRNYNARNNINITLEYYV